MSIKNSKLATRFLVTLVCAAATTFSAFNGPASAQAKRSKSAAQNIGSGPVINATLTDSFSDPRSDGSVQPGDEITYTSTITNNGEGDAFNVSITNPIDANVTLVADSVAVQRDMRSFAVRCTFSTATGGSGGCDLPIDAFAQTGDGISTILAGQDSTLKVSTANVNYNAETGIFAFDATVQNLVARSIGSLDDSVVDAAGIRLFLNSAMATEGNGLISAINADGTATFTAHDQPYFQYDEILLENQISNARSLQISVPNTVSTFTVDFLISAKVLAKPVNNEFIGNPGGTISDANGTAENVAVTIGLLAAGQTATVTYRVTIGNPLPVGTTEISNQVNVAGDNFASKVTDDPKTIESNDATMTRVNARPSTSRVTISGRIMNADGVGVSNATVSLTDITGSVRSVRTRPFGHYRIADVQAGQTFIFEVVSKRYQFAPQLLNVVDDMYDVNATANP